MLGHLLYNMTVKVWKEDRRRFKEIECEYKRRLNYVLGVQCTRRGWGPFKHRWVPLDDCERCVTEKHGGADGFDMHSS